MTPATVEIRRRVYGQRYPRNGNLGMTQTDKVTWDLFVNGQLAVPSIPTLREATTLAAAHGPFTIRRDLTA